MPPSPAVTGRSSVVDTVNIAAGGTKTVNLTEKSGLYGAQEKVAEVTQVLILIPVDKLDGMLDSKHLVQ